MGWYWHSTYSWGWAPFHYGRWHRSASTVGTGVPVAAGHLGSLAFVRYLLRLGTVAPGCDYVTGVEWLDHGSASAFIWAEPSPLHLLRLRLSPPSAPAPAPRAGQRCHNRSQRNQGGEQSHHRKQHHDHQQRCPAWLVEKKTREPIRVRIREMDLELTFARVGQIDENRKTLAVYRPTVPTPRIRHPAKNQPAAGQQDRDARHHRGEKPSTTDNKTDDDKDNGRRIAKQHGNSQLEKPGNTKISGSKSILTPRPLPAQVEAAAGPPQERDVTAEAPRLLLRHPASPHDLAQQGAARPRSLVKPLSAAVPHCAAHRANSSAGGQATGACQTKFHRPLAGLQALHAQHHGENGGPTARANQPAPSSPGGKSAAPARRHLATPPQHASPSSDARTLHLPEFPTKFTVLQGAEPLCPPHCHNPSSRPRDVAFRRQAGHTSSIEKPLTAGAPTLHRVASRPKSFLATGTSSAPSRSYSPPSRSISRPSAPSRSSSPPSSNPPSSSSGPPQGIRSKSTSWGNTLRRMPGSTQARIRLASLTLGVLLTALGQAQVLQAGLSRMRIRHEIHPYPTQGGWLAEGTGGSGG